MAEARNAAQVNGRMRGRRVRAASESCAFATIGAEAVREIQPGEIVRIDATRLRDHAGRAAAETGLLHL